MIELFNSCIFHPKYPASGSDLGESTSGHLPMGIGVGAGKFLGLQKILVQKVFQFSGNYLCKYFLPHRSWTPSFGKGILLTLGANFSKSNNIGCQFCPYFCPLLTPLQITFPNAYDCAFFPEVHLKCNWRGETYWRTGLRICKKNVK